MKLERHQAITVLLVLVFAVPALAQWRQNPTTGSSEQRLADRTNIAGMTGLGPQLEANFKDRSDNAKQKRVVVEVETWGVDLISPGSNQPPRNDQAYLLYRVDDQPIVKTADKEHTFENLSPGYHSISVQLSASDGSLRGARQVLSIHIPS